MNIFKLFRSRVTRNLKVSFARLDPSSRILIVYNDEKPLRNINLEVKDEYGDIYKVRIRKLEPNQEYLLPLDKIVDEEGKPIEAIRSIRAHVNRHIEYFRLKGREFHRA